ncbi:enolase-phosphatase E1-like [Argopecten irradians]|uniref:enolase-phosphatase E1-like n=1 Tax=Argopecten irradians TaxID=31199 RepID=UPI0037150F5C
MITNSMNVTDNSKRKVKTQEEYKREFTKWKKEKELKRKLEKRNQKPLFKVYHVAHADTSIYNKNAKKGSSTFVPSKTKQKIVEPEAQVIKAPAKIPAVKSKKPEVSKPVSKVSALAPVTGRVTSSQNAAKENKNVNIQSKPNRPTTRSTRTSQKQKICDSVKTSASKKNVNEKKVAGKTSASKKNVNEKKVAGKKKPSNLNLEKVSTSRGISFAPDDFTFSSPSSVSTYEFKTLSPASTANFLYPATTSFISTDPKRCSTPKPHSHEEDSRVNTVDCSLMLADVSTRSRTSASKVNGVDTSYQRLPKAIPETRRVTRSLRQSILDTTTPVTEVHDQSDCQSTTKTCEQTDISKDTESGNCVKLSATPLDMKKGDKAVPKRMTRSLRRSLCMSPPSEALDSPKKVFTPKHKAKQVPVLATTEEVESSKSLEDEVFSNSPTKESDVNQTPERRNTRRTMSNFATFAPPSNDCLVLSAPRSKKKRRKTQHDHPVNPKSPEEWVKLLKNSPMVEMNRRTPRTTPLEPLLGLDLDMEFDVDQQTSQPTGETETGTMSLQSTELPNAPSTTVNVAVPCTLQTDSAPCQQLTSVVTQDDTAKLEDSNVEMSEPTVLNQESSEKHNEVPSKPEEHDVEYFRNLMATETNTFNGYCSKWEDVSKSTPEIDEEVEGQIRTCIGQAQLLIAQRFKQFKGLVDNCEFRTGEKETTLTDLQGFWDMIYYQFKLVISKELDSKFRLINFEVLFYFPSLYMYFKIG